MLRIEVGDVFEILDKINLVQVKWKRLFQNFIFGLLIETYNFGNRWRKFFFFYFWSCFVRRVVLFYYFKDWDRGFGKFMLWVFFLVLIWFFEGYDCMIVSLRRVQKSGSQYVIVNVVVFVLEVLGQEECFQWVKIVYYMEEIGEVL